MHASVMCKANAWDRTEKVQTTANDSVALYTATVIGSVNFTTKFSQQHILLAVIGDSSGLVQYIGHNVSVLTCVMAFLSRRALRPATCLRPKSRKTCDYE
jgi:hypothetical protein